jgi:hypothetical protein
MVHFSPVGILPSRWDGQSEIEWLSTDNPIVCIRADYEVKGFLLEIGRNTLPIEPGKSGEPIYVELGELAVGQHLLKVYVRELDDKKTTEAEIVNIQIRTPREIRSHSDASAPLFVLVDPPLPTIEQFWTGELDIEVYGPSNQALDIDFTLLGRKNEILGRINGVQEKLLPPISKQQSREWIERYIVSNKKIQAAYDDAESCRLKVSAGEFGTSIIEAVREYTPLRWSVLASREKQSFDIRVLDDTGEESPVRVEHYPLSTPDRVERLTDSVDKIHSAKPGLYVCYQGSFREAIFIPRKVKTFFDLKLENISFERPAVRVIDLVISRIKLLALWESAKLAGHEELTSHFKKKTIKAIQQNIGDYLGVDRWLNRDEIENLEPNDQFVVPARIRHPRKADIFSRIQDNVPELLTLPAAEIPEKLGQYWVESLYWKGRLPWLPSFTISLLTRPSDLLQEDNVYSLREGLESLTQHQFLAASAQLMLLLLYREKISGKDFWTVQDEDFWRKVL